MKGFLYTIILLGAIQGIIMGCLLFFANKKSLSDRLLALIIWLIALPGIHLYFHYAGWFDYNRTMQIVHALLPLVLIMPVGPLIYFYVRALLEPDYRLTKKDKLHFLPVLIDLVPKMVEIIFITGAAIHLLKPDQALVTNIINTYSKYADIPRWISMSAYIILTAKYLRTHKTKLNGSINAYQRATIHWLKTFTRLFITFQLIWLIYLVPYIIPRYSDLLLYQFDWFPVYIPMAILIYWLGFKGYSVSHLMQESPKRNGQGVFSLSEQVVNNALGLLKQSMEKEKLYLNPALNLAVLSKHTGLSPKIISAVLNQYQKKSFNEFINTYRIDEFKQRISQSEDNHLTIAGMAAECGFNSPATFQRTFKQLTGISPSEFRKTV